MGGARMKQGGQVILSAIRRGPEKGRGWLSSALGSWAADDDDVIGGTKKTHERRICGLHPAPRSRPAYSCTAPQGGDAWADLHDTVIRLVLELWGVARSSWSLQKLRLRMLCVSSARCPQCSRFRTGLVSEGDPNT